MLLLAIFVFVLICIATFLTFLRLTNTKGRKVSVLVLGDIGRSPRMQYHCLSLVKAGFEVDLIGYGGSIPHKDITSNSKISLHHLTEPPAFILDLPTLMRYISKVIWQSVNLFYKLMGVSKTSYILVQNPPAIPTLAVAWVISVLRGCKLVVDWHNYGYTILSLSLKNRHPLVRFSKWYEKFFGQFSHHNICVTNAMSRDLKDNWNISAGTMYDRPPAMFRETSIADQHDLYIKLAKDYDVFKSSKADEKDTSYTVFTEKCGRDVVLRADRPALLVSGTSWTEDEDFSILLTALEKYETCKKEDNALPDLICVITGKGPQKDYYTKLIKEKSWTHVSICTPWLEAEDYPKLLGSADLGVCLHYSSSGLDLPMKVVDMFGCALPVCAINFKCLGELVKHEENGLVFHNEQELASHIQDLLRGYPDVKKLKTFRKNLQIFQETRWDEAWKTHVAHIFSEHKTES